MPSYDYRCPDNDRVIEVRHRMSESLSTWGEVCARAGLDLGETAEDAPVERLIAECGAIGGSSGAGAAPAAPACRSGFT